MKAWYSKVRDTELKDGSVRATYVVTFETDSVELKRKVEKYLQSVMDEAEQTEPSDDWICNTCKYHTIERAVQCKMCGDGGQYEPKQTENCSEIPNNCEYAENPSGDVWECGCFLDTYCEHQIYDWNPDGTINIVECGYEPKTEPQTERSDDAE